MTHFISITMVGGKIKLVGNLRIKDFLNEKTILNSCTWIELLENAPFWVAQIEQAFQLDLISLNRNINGDIVTIDIVFDNPKAR